MKQHEHAQFYPFFKIAYFDILLFAQSTVHTAPSLTILHHNPPHIPAVYITPLNRAPNNQS